MASSRLTAANWAYLNDLIGEAESKNNSSTINAIFPHANSFAAPPPAPTIPIIPAPAVASNAPSAKYQQLLDMENARKGLRPRAPAISTTPNPSMQDFTFRSPTPYPVALSPMPVASNALAGRLQHLQYVANTGESLQPPAPVFSTMQNPSMQQHLQDFTFGLPVQYPIAPSPTPVAYNALAGRVQHPQNVAYGGESLWPCAPAISTTSNQSVQQAPHMSSVSFASPHLQTSPFDFTTSYPIAFSHAASPNPMMPPTPSISPESLPSPSIAVSQIPLPRAQLPAPRSVQQLQPAARFPIRVDSPLQAPQEWPINVSQMQSPRAQLPVHRSVQQSKPAARFPIRVDSPLQTAQDWPALVPQTPSLQTQSPAPRNVQGPQPTARPLKRVGSPLQAPQDRSVAVSQAPSPRAQLATPRKVRKPQPKTKSPIRVDSPVQVPSAPAPTIPAPTTPTRSIHAPSISAPSLAAAGSYQESTSDADIAQLLQEFIHEEVLRESAQAQISNNSAQSTAQSGQGEYVPAHFVMKSALGYPGP